MTDVQFFIDADATPVNQRNSVYLWDDFISTTGQLNWTAAGTGSTANAVIDANHPGVTLLQTGTSANNEETLTLPAVEFDALASFEMIFRPAIVGAARMRVGALVGPTASTPTDGVAVEIDTGLGDSASTMTLRKYVGGVRSDGNTLAVTGLHWYRLNWFRTGAGAGTLTVTDPTAVTSATSNFTGLTDSASVLLVFAMKTLDTSQDTLSVDWAQIVLLPAR